MPRRHFVAALGLATASLATRPVRLAARAPRRIAVVGGGIMGASIAYHLAKRGAEVHLFEKRAPATSRPRTCCSGQPSHMGPS